MTNAETFYLLVCIISVAINIALFALSYNWFKVLLRIIQLNRDLFMKSMDTEFDYLSRINRMYGKTLLELMALNKRYRENDI